MSRKSIVKLMHVCHSILDSWILASDTVNRLILRFYLISIKKDQKILSEFVPLRNTIPRTAVLNVTVTRSHFISEHGWRVAWVCRRAKPGRQPAHVLLRYVKEPAEHLLASPFFFTTAWVVLQLPHASAVVSAASFVQMRLEHFQIEIDARFHLQLNGKVLKAEHRKGEGYSKQNVFFFFLISLPLRPGCNLPHLRWSHPWWSICRWTFWRAASHRPPARSRWGTGTCCASTSRPPSVSGCSRTPARRRETGRKTPGNPAPWPSTRFSARQTWTRPTRGRSYWSVRPRTLRELHPYLARWAMPSKKKKTGKKDKAEKRLSNMLAVIAATLRPMISMPL